MRRPWPLGAGAGHGVGEDAFASGGGQGVPLQGGVLVDGQDASIAQKHATFSDKINRHVSY